LRIVPQPAGQTDCNGKALFPVEYLGELFATVERLHRADSAWSVLGGRKAFDEIEQALTSWLDMTAVLNVVRRPEMLGGCIATLVEQRVEGF
jgi:hypothetical protein